MSDEKYYLDHYGKCDADKCFCAHQGWLGTYCYNWITMGAKNIEELRIAQRKITNEQQVLLLP